MALSKKRIGEIASIVLTLSILEELSKEGVADFIQISQNEFEQLCKDVLIEKEAEFKDELKKMGVEWQEFREFLLVVYQDLQKALNNKEVR